MGLQPPTVLSFSAGKGQKKGADVGQAPSSVAGKTKKLEFFNGNGGGFANFHAAFAAQALVHVNRNGFVILQFKNTHGAGIYAIGIPSAFVGIYGYLEHRSSLLAILIIFIPKKWCLYKRTPLMGLFGRRPKDKRDEIRPFFIKGQIFFRSIKD
jgi:hypothetical protein